MKGFLEHGPGNIQTDRSEAILSHFVARYGERILAAPKFQGFGGFAYFLPAAFLLAGAFLVLFLIRRLRAGAGPVPVPIKTSEDPKSQYLERLHREMWG